MIFYPKSKEEIELGLAGLSVHDRFMLECRVELNEWLIDNNISTQMIGEQHNQIVSGEIFKTLTSLKYPVTVTEINYQRLKKKIINITKNNIKKNTYVYVHN